MDFQPGDLVRLKSGGPTMTVEQVSTRAMTGEPGVWCVWFEGAGSKQTCKRDTFSPVVLEKTSGSSASFSVTR
jgi:uncharacterized protein YodC (DUF2158 family)